VVERTFSWFGENRRLAGDFENLAETLGAFVALASIQLALRRLARAQAVNSTSYRFALHDDGGLQRMVMGPSPERVATTRKRRKRASGWE
jgi:hypothetical protein